VLLSELASKGLAALESFDYREFLKGRNTRPLWPKFSGFQGLLKKRVATQPDGGKHEKCTLYMEKHQPRELAVQTRGDMVEVTLPELELWGVLKFT